MLRKEYEKSKEEGLKGAAAADDASGQKLEDKLEYERMELKD